MQSELRQLGLYGLAVDGVWGGRSTEALRMFQRREGLAETGAVEDGVRLLPQLRVAERAAGCRVRVTHAGAILHEAPSHLAVELPIGDLSGRTYDVIDTRLVNWAGKQERWYRIRVDGHVGWTVGRQMLLTATGPECY